MVDKKLEADIKKTKEFIELWREFHRIFENTLSDNSVSSKWEKTFLSTKTLVNARYDDLMDSLGVKPIKRFIKSENIYNIFSVNNLSVMSDEKLKAVEADWSGAQQLLTGLLKRLERKKKRIEAFNGFAFVLKKGLGKIKPR
ncbi:MAG: hypothetical protein JW994_07305 [Candidatus Omnitrophica bacterium]|nr:hypothetical protein [Candidatus Omnitrophota bacterium]